MRDRRTKIITDEALPRDGLRRRIPLVVLFALWLLVGATMAQTPQRKYPSEIRGYKVAQARVIVASDALNESNKETDDARVTLGAARVVKITPLGVTLEVPVTIAPLKQGGRVDFIAFEDITVNDGDVELPDYTLPFKLPDDKPFALQEPLRVFIAAPQAVTVLVDDWWAQKEEWRVTGRAYVFGSFKKFLFNFKRVVPVEFDLLIANPLRQQTSAR